MVENFELGFSSAINLSSKAWLNGEKPEGFSQIEICAGYHPKEDDETRKMCMNIYTEDYNHAIKDGLKLWSVHLPYGDDLDLTVDETRSDEIIENFAFYVNELSKFSPKYYVVHVFAHEPVVVDDREKIVKQSNNNIRELAKIIDKTGATLCVEALPRTNFGNTSKECLELIKDTKAELCLDANHLTVETHREFLSVAGKHVKTLHLSDYDFVDEKHWIPGDGKLNWRELLDLLKEFNYKGPLMFEAKFHKNGHEPTIAEIRDGLIMALSYDMRCI